MRNLALKFNGQNTPIFAILTHFAKCCRSGYKFECVLLLCSHFFFAS